MKKSLGRWCTALVVVLLCMYAPFCWLFIFDYPWSPYRWHWIRMAPVLPGFLAALPMPPTDAARIAAMSATTIGLIGVNTYFASRGRWQLAAAATLVLAISTVSSWGAYAAFRM